LKRVGRKTDAELGREGHLTPEQVEALIKAARQNRHGQGDGLMISLAWHHGLRASELVGLRWSDIDWRRADIAVTRLKNGKSTRQPLDGGDLRALRAIYRDRQSDEFVFMSERGPFTRDGFAKLLRAAAKRAGVKNAHPHFRTTLATAISPTRRCTRTAYRGGSKGFGGTRVAPIKSRLGTAIWIITVRFGPLCGLKSDITQGPRSAISRLLMSS
jgi:integrase